MPPPMSPECAPHRAPHRAPSLCALIVPPHRAPLMAPGALSHAPFVRPLSVLPLEAEITEAIANRQSEFAELAAKQAPVG